MNGTGQSVLWGMALSLFIGGLGFPVPENPLLIAGGYALSQKMSDPVLSPPFWFLAIVSGDTILFCTVRWLFTMPLVKKYILKMVGAKRLEMYQRAFLNHGGWTLFLARFTFGIRAAAYVAAGAASYPWLRFLAVDGVSVAIQLLLFISLGYYAGDRISWAQATGQTIALLLTGAVVVSIATSLIATKFIRRFTDKGQTQG